MYERLLEADGRMAKYVPLRQRREAIEILSRLFPHPVAAAAALAAMPRKPLRRPAPRQFWTDEEVELLRDLYPVTPTRDLAEAFGRPVASIYNQAFTLGIRKSPEYLASPAACRLRRGDHIGRATQFKPGQKPWNTGKKLGPAKGRSAETTFKPGERSGKAAENYMPVGSEREIEGYLYTKVSDVPNVPYTVNWRPTHHLVWEEASGPVPEGHVLVFRDGNPKNTGLENLELISRAELMRRNTIQRYPEEMREVMRLRGRIRRELNKRERDDGT